jgi:hypothetical protein
MNPAADTQNRLKPVAAFGGNLFQQVWFTSCGFESAAGPARAAAAHPMGVLASWR